MRPGRIRVGRSMLVVAVVLLGLLAAGCVSGSSGKTPAAPTTTTAARSASAGAPSLLAPVHGRYSPSIVPSNFVSMIDNPYFPLIPGTGFHYKGVAENGKTPQRDDEYVTHQTRQIMGVTATVVRDVVSQGGHAVERTFDWYAQDKQGNVWYMGEDTRELHHGRFVRASDSWEGGVNGAEPGIIMPGHPQPGQEYRQEYYPHHALDQARVLGQGGAVTVPYAHYGKTLLTDESSPALDPGIHEHKYYVAGIGDVKEETVAGDREEIELVRITHSG